MNERILIVDDEDPIRDVVGRYLHKDGFETLLARDGEEALRLVSDADLVILDVMLPSLDGLEVCRRLRAHGNVPVIMLTARRRVADRIVGLALGADDYVLKPFSPRELVARVQALLRRVAPRPLTDDVIRFDDLRINVQKRVAERAGTAIELTAH
ncbi:MAG: DNA-binding response regulator, partial [Chloroflexi bacterium]